MKKNVITLTLTILLLSGQVVSASTGKITASKLRVRSKSSVLSSTIGYLYKNNKVDTLSREGDFYKISYKGKNGYIHSSYVNILSSENGKASTSRMKVGQTTASHLNVRAGASTKYTVIGGLVRNSRVNLYEKVNGFYKINYKGKIGYISGDYVKIGESSTSPEPSKSQALDEKASLDTKIGETTASSLNVRSGAGTGYAVIGGLSRGTKVNLYDNVNGFYKINYKGKMGYISDDYVKVLEKTSLENNQQYDSGTNVDDIVDYAKSFLGMPYAISGTTPARYDGVGKYIGGGFDCSGYTQYIFKKFGITLPRISRDQANIGTTVNINNLQKGNLLFFATNSGKPSEISHVGIYIGDNKFIHSPKVNDVIRISEFNGYFRSNFIVARRVVE